MSVDAQIQDGLGSARRAFVTSDHALKVTTVPLRTIDISQEDLTRRRYFNDFLKDPGTSSFDLNVDGSVTPVEYEIIAIEGFVIFVSTIRLIFHDTNMDMGGGNAGRFASVTAGLLPNGLKLTVDQGGLATDVFTLPVRQMADFFNYSEDFSNITGAFGGGLDYLSFDVHFTTPVPLSVPIADRVYVTVQDNLTSLSLFQVVASGTKELL